MTINWKATLPRLAGVGYVLFTVSANLAPMSTPVVPGLSQLTPVWAEVTQFGRSEGKFVSHQEFNSIRNNPFGGRPAAPAPVRPAPVRRPAPPVRPAAPAQWEIDGCVGAADLGILREFQETTGIDCERALAYGH